jgi:glucose dehydrogenase
VGDTETNFSKLAYRNVVQIILMGFWVVRPPVMRPDTSHAPADAHSLRTTVAAAALVVAVTFATVAVAAAPRTTATVAATTVAVLGVQRGIAAYRGVRWDPLALHAEETDG